MDCMYFNGWNFDLFTSCVAALRMRIGGKVAECVGKPPQAANTNRKAGADQALEVHSSPNQIPSINLSRNPRICLLQRVAQHGNGWHSGSLAATDVI